MKKLILVIGIILSTYSSKAFFDFDELKSKDSVTYSFVEEWLGTHYRFGGENMGGIDCSAFSREFYATRYNIELPRIAKEQYSVVTKIKKTALELGDLVFFRNHGPSGWHVGVYLFDGYFVHAANKKSGVKISNLSDAYYVKTYLNGGRI